MSGISPASIPVGVESSSSDTAEVELLPLHVEKVVLSKRVRRTVVKAVCRTETREEVEVEQIPGTATTTSTTMDPRAPKI